MRLLPWASALLLTLACASRSGARPTEDGPRSQAPPGFWDLWGDGQAELDGYALRQSRYGELRTGEAVLVFVTETFTDAQRVKSDGGHDDEYPVFKLNDSRHFQTGIYDYRTMTSAWARLDGGQPLGLATKISTSVQEWCGHATLELLVDPTRYRLNTQSYFDGEGDRRTEGKLEKGGLMADILPILVRGLAGELVGPGQSRQLPYLGRLLDDRFTHKDPGWTSATLSRAAAVAPAAAPEGQVAAWTWTVQEASGQKTSFVVEDASPHRLLAWSRSDGEEGRLLGTLRTAYWKENHEGDEGLRARLGLPAPVWPQSPPSTPVDH